MCISGYIIIQLDLNREMLVDFTNRERERGRLNFGKSGINWCWDLNESSYALVIPVISMCSS